MDASSGPARYCEQQCTVISTHYYRLPVFEPYDPFKLEARIADFRRNPIKALVPDCLQNLLRSSSIVGQKASKRWGHGCPFHVDHDKAPIKPAPASPLVDHDNPLRRHSSEDKPPTRQGVCRNQIGFLKWLRWIRDPRS